MGDVIFIRINEPRAMQALEGYKKDAQTFLVQKAVVDYFERHSTLSIKDILKAGGLAGNGRRQPARGGNGRKLKPVKKERRPVQEDQPAHEQRSISSTGKQSPPPQENFERAPAARRVVEVGIGVGEHETKSEGSGKPEGSGLADKVGRFSPD